MTGGADSATLDLSRRLRFRSVLGSRCLRKTRDLAGVADAEGGLEKPESTRHVETEGILMLPHHALVWFPIHLRI